MSTLAKPESWFHSPEFDSEYRSRRAQQRAWFERKAKETVADPDDFQPSKVAARENYLKGVGGRKRRGDPCYELPRGCGLQVEERVRPERLPEETDLEYLGRLVDLPQSVRGARDDLQALADTFRVRPERLLQARGLQKGGLATKATRLLFCGVIGHRVNCSGSEGHKFFEPYMCHGRYCDVCGPQWFREKFSNALFALEPVVEHLLHEGQRRDREMVVAKLDFTVPNTGSMPRPEFIRKFHADLRRFFRALERRFGISRSEYGVAGCDEFGGGNTNLHRHCVYVGPRLPQSKARKELSALWSEIRGERSFVSIKHAESFRAALAHALKYPAKFLSVSTPERLAELEAAFHGTRRFAASGAFYNVKAVREPGEDSPVGNCPLCGARLCEIVEPWVPRFVLEGEGRRSVEAVRREIGKAKVFSRAGPP